MNKNGNSVQFSKILKNPAPQYIIAEVKKIFNFSYSSQLYSRILSNFKIVVSLFEGKFPGYMKCSTEYHNLSHTLDVMLASVRMIDGYNLSVGKMDQDLAVTLLLASLYHDTGYIKEDWDTSGTGAKYTMVHVKRSIEFIKKNSINLRLNPGEENIISNIISCTSSKQNLHDINFNNHEEEIAGVILGSADLLGQMADRLYLEKLLFLYNEYKEAGVEGYETEYDIIKNTADFYSATLERLTKDLFNVHDYCRAHFRERFGIDRNLYMTAISKNIEYLNKIIEDNSSNFRKKLKRKISYMSTLPSSVQ